MSTESDRPRRTRKMRPVQVAIFLLFLGLAGWGISSFLLHKPKSNAGYSEVTEAPSLSPVAVSEEELLLLKKVPVEALDLLPAGMIAGFVAHDPTKIGPTLSAFHLSPLLDSPEIAKCIALASSSFLGETVCGVYPDKNGKWLIRGSLIPKKGVSADEQERKLTDLAAQIAANPVFGFSSFKFKRQGDSFGFSLGESEPVILEKTPLKPVARLSRTTETQALIGIEDSSVIVFGDIAAFVTMLDAKYPVAVEGENSILTVFKGLDLHNCWSAAVGLKIGASGPVSRLQMHGIRGEGLVGMISEFPESLEAAKVFPSSTVLYASQSLDLARIMQSWGGLLHLTNPSERAKLPADIERFFSSNYLSVGMISRAFYDEVAIGLMLDGMIPEFEIAVRVQDDEVVKSYLEIATTQKLLVKRQLLNSDVYVATSPIISVPITPQFKFEMTPGIARVGEYLVITSNFATLSRAINSASGKEPSLSTEARFKDAAAQAAGCSSFIFARPAAMMRVISPWLQQIGFTAPAEMQLDEAFSSWAARRDRLMTVECSSSVPLLVANHVLRPDVLAIALSVVPVYDRVITMALQAANWVGSKLCYYDVQHMALKLDTTGSELKCTAEITAKNLVDNSTGYMLALNTGLKVDSATLDGAPVQASRTGMFVGIPSPVLLPKGHLSKIVITYSGIPVDYVASLPSPLKAALQGFFRPIQTTDLLEYNFASFFYPIPPCVRNRAWTWETELTVPPGFSAVANGRLTAKRPASEAADAPWIWTYVGDRPEMACEIIVGKFDTVDDPGVDFTVHHFFETGVVKDTAEPVKFARDCYSYYATTFGGDFYRDPIVVHLRPRPMISHCISYAVLYTRERAVLAHEMAHLWWGSTVKQNPIESSMWYEGLAEYSVMMYSRTRFGPVEFLKQLSMSNARWRRADQGPYSFRDIRQWSPDRALGYVKGVALFRGLETVLGPEKFGEFLRKLAAKKDEFPDVQQIREICVGLVPTCDWYFRNGFMGLGSFDIEARNAVKIGPGKWEVTIRSVGMSEWRAPVTIIVRNASGQIAATTVTIPREGKIVAEINVEVEEFDILVDPFEDIPDANLSNNVIAIRPK